MRLTDLTRRSLSGRPLRRHARPVALAVASALVAAGPTAPVATAATAVSGLTTIDLAGSGYTQLGRAGITLAASGDATLAKRRIILPATTATFGKQSTTVRQGGSLVLRHRVGATTRLTRLTDLRIELGAQRQVTAKLGGKRTAILSLDLLKGEYTVTAGSGIVSIPGARATLTPAAARALASRLKAPKLRGGAFGVVGASTGLPTTGSSSTTTGSSTGSSTSGGSTGTGTTQAVSGPTPLARPASAVDVTSSPLVWRVRESFVRYMNTEEAPTAFDGAIAGATEVIAPSSAALVYEYSYPAAAGWYDPVSGSARITYSGGVRFRYLSHGIDFDVTALEVELSGSSSRVIANYVGRAATPFTGREVLMELDAAGAAAPAVDGQQRTWTRLAGRIAASGVSTFAGFYQAGDPFGAVSLTLTLP
ncbi:MAG: HtaA domain-containing protein [Patulibacter sp.]